MEKIGIYSLPKDVIELLTKEMSQSDLIRFCSSQMSDEIKSLCKSNQFWMRRFQKDFSLFFYVFDKKNKDGTNKNIKQIYLQIFSLISKQAEKITQFLDKYLKPEYKKEDLYNISYKYVLDILEKIFERGEGQYYSKNGLFDDLFISYEFNYSEEHIKPFAPILQKSFLDIDYLFLKNIKDDMYQIIKKIYYYIPDKNKRETVYK